MSKVVTTPTGLRRETRLTLQVAGAEPMRLLGNLAEPFEVELVWLNGVLAVGSGTIRGYRVKSDGTVGRAVATGMVSARRALQPEWIRDLLSTVVEPTDTYTGMTKLVRRHQYRVDAYKQWRSHGMSTHAVWRHGADGKSFSLLYELLPTMCHDRLTAAINALQGRESAVRHEITAEFDAACQACWPGKVRPNPPAISPDEIARFWARTAGSKYAGLLVDLLNGRGIHHKVWALIEPPDDGS
jgi:hypothetical protein